MRLKSTISPTESNGDVPIAIVCFGEQRKFLKRSLDFHDMIRTIQERFGIDSEHTLSLVTSSFEVCRGNQIEIDESAYSLMCPALDEIIVVLEGKKLSRVDEKEQVPITPRTTPPADAPLEPEHINIATSAARTRTPAKNKRQETSSVPGPNRTHHDERVEYDEEEVGEMLFNEDQDEEEEDEEEEDKQGGEKEEEQLNKQVYPEKNPREELKPRQHKRDVFDSPRSSPRPTSTKGRAVKEAQPPVIKEEKVTKPTTPEPPVPIPVPESDENKRFSISVMGPRPTHRAEFKTRGKHLVKKVLVAACKTFGLDYEKASLHLVLEVEEVDGVCDMIRRRCNLDETVTQCGIEEGSVLEVLLSKGGLGDSESDEFSQS